MKKKNYICLGLMLAVLASCSKEDSDRPQTYDFSHWEVGQVIKDENGWTEVVVGDFPLVLGVPHGGDMMPSDIEDRQCEGITTSKDTWTVETARAIQEEYRIVHNKIPSVIICHLHRLKIDQNRPLEEALCANDMLAPTWHFYHNYMDSLLQYSSQKFGKTLFIDLHAHGHAIQRLELGHNLTTRELGYVHTGHEQLSHVGDLRANSSYANLFKMNPGLSLKETLLGDYAFGTLMHERGFPSVPSKQDPHPMASHSYFTGGFNTNFATSASYPNVYGFQIEANGQSKNTEARRLQFAKSLAESVEIMLERF